MKKRDYLLDTLKGIGIVCVVFGHFFEPLRLEPEGAILDCIVKVIYSFHMPLFCIISGLLAKFNIRRVVKWAVIYLAGQLVFFIVRYVTLWEIPSRNIIMPYFHFWYLYCLIIWSLSIPIISLIREKNVYIKAFFLICVSMGCLYLGKVNCSFFCGTNRLIAFYPLFFAGGVYSPEYFLHIQNENRKRNRALINTFISVLFVLVIIMIVVFHDKVNMNIFYSDQTYYAGEYSWMERCLFYCWGLVVFCVLVSIIRINQGVLGLLGANSFWIYFSHAYLYYFFKHTIVKSGLSYFIKVILAILLSGFILWVIPLIHKMRIKKSVIKQ